MRRPATPRVPIAAARAGTSVPMGAMWMPTADEVAAARAARPAYVKVLPEAGQAAYAYALARPDVLQWLPCYCGCGGMGHGSNLACFFARREVEGTFTFEEHGSCCNICIETANLASDMLRQGSTMTQIRAAVDSTFGGGAVPGTDTPLPPPASRDAGHMRAPRAVCSRGFIAGRQTGNRAPSARPPPCGSISSGCSG